MAINRLNLFENFDFGLLLLNKLFELDQTMTEYVPWEDEESCRFWGQRSRSQWLKID